MWIFNSKVFGFENPFDAFFHAQLYIKVLDNQALMGGSSHSKTSRIKD